MKCNNCVEGLIGEDLRKVCEVCKGTSKVINLEEEVQAIEPEMEVVEKESFLEETVENWDDVSADDS